jgi:hypothetical protein
MKSRGLNSYDILVEYDYFGRSKWRVIRNNESLLIKLSKLMLFKYLENVLNIIDVAKFQEIITISFSQVLL